MWGLCPLICLLTIHNGLLRSARTRWGKPLSAQVGCSTGTVYDSKEAFWLALQGAAHSRAPTIAGADGQLALAGPHLPCVGALVSR